MAIDTSNLSAVGDFNLHMYDESNNDCRRVLDLLKVGLLAFLRVGSSRFCTRSTVILYAAPLSKIIRNLMSHFNADDTQIYITVKIRI